MWRQWKLSPTKNKSSKVVGVYLKLECPPQGWVRTYKWLTRLRVELAVNSETQWGICGIVFELDQLVHVWSLQENGHKQAAVLSFYAFALASNESVACSNKPTLFFVVNSGFNNISTVEPGCLKAPLGRTPIDINPLYPKVREGCTESQNHTISVI